MVATVPKLTLTYFNFGARAEPIRLAAAIGKIPFTNHAIAFKDWKELKPKTPLGQMPILDIAEADGHVDTVVQSTAILRYFGQVGGLYPTDPVKALKVDSFLDTAAEATKPIEMSVQGAVKNFVSDKDWTKEEVMVVRRRIVENKEHGLPFYLSYFESSLKQNGTGWLVGDKVTIADLQLHRITSWIGSGMLDGIPPELLSDYPLLKAHDEKIEALPEVVAWRAKYPIPYTDFEFKP